MQQDLIFIIILKKVSDFTFYIFAVFLPDRFLTHGRCCSEVCQMDEWLNLSFIMSMCDFCVKTVFLFKEIHKKNSTKLLQLIEEFTKSIIIMQLKVQYSKTLADRKALRNYRLQQNLLIDRY